MVHLCSFLLPRISVRPTFLTSKCPTSTTVLLLHSQFLRLVKILMIRPFRQQLRSAHDDRSSRLRQTLPEHTRPSTDDRPKCSRYIPEALSPQSLDAQSEHYSWKSSQATLFSYWYPICDRSAIGGCSERA